MISCPTWKSPPFLMTDASGTQVRKMDRTYLLGTTCSPRHWSLTPQWPGEKFSVRVAVNDPETYQTVTQQISLVALRIELIHSTSPKQVTLLDVLLNISSITSYLGPKKSAKCRRRLHFPLARPRKRPMHKLKKSPSKSLLRMSIGMPTRPGLSGWAVSTLA